MPATHIHTPPQGSVLHPHGGERLSRQPRGLGRVQLREHPRSGLSPRWEVLPGTVMSQGNGTEETGFRSEVRIRKSSSLHLTLGPHKSFTGHRAWLFTH